MNSLSRLASHLLFATLASLFLLSASGNAAPAKDAWTKGAKQTAVGGFIAGKATAPAKLVEYVSYTCPHCAHLETEEMPKIGNGIIAAGKANIEIRNYWRDGPDLMVAMLARCGGPNRFFANHHFLMAAQAQWRPRAAQIKPETAALFNANYGMAEYLDLDTVVKYMRNAFDEMQLAQVIKPLKIKPAAVQACLSDKAALQQILRMTDDAIINLGVVGTPTFLFNGVRDEELYDFATIKARVDRG